MESHPFCTQKRVVPTHHRTVDAPRWRSRPALDVGEGQKSTKRFFKKNEQKKQKRTVSAFFTRDFVCANLYYYFHLFYSMGLDYLSILYLSISHAIIELCLYNSTNLTISSLCQNV
jgi:hypothetical protein